jgi:uncharacterized protein (TIGR02145 family)
MISRISSYKFVLLVLLILALSCSKEDKPPDPVDDIEGNTYKTVRIGDQIWMAENLKTTLYNDGTEIPLIKDGAIWTTLTTPGFCWYNNDEETYKEIYGALYNGFVVSTGNLCPVGWHVPESEEWQQLRDYLGDTISGGGKLKESGTNHWNPPNKGADNNSKFSALPAGIRYFEGSFNAGSYFTSFWSASEIDSTNVWYLSLYYGDAVATMSYRSKKYGFSVRCIRD